MTVQDLVHAYEVKTEKMERSAGISTYDEGGSRIGRVGSRVDGSGGERVPSVKRKKIICFFKH